MLFFCLRFHPSIIFWLIRGWVAGAAAQTSLPSHLGQFFWENPKLTDAWRSDASMSSTSQYWIFLHLLPCMFQQNWKIFRFVPQVFPNVGTLLVNDSFAFSSIISVHRGKLMKACVTELHHAGHELCVCLGVIHLKSLYQVIILICCFICL
uniref:Secreted protein n=1 Tax=Poecilia reticulata TaxID=8081 RepID=A0A3P9N7S2_POERE